MGLFDRFRRPQTAAVKPLTDADRRGWRRLRQPWQERAEFMAANMGVVRFASGVGADACARSDLRVEKLVDPTHDTWEPSEDNLLAGLLRQYRGKRTTQRELVRQHAWHEDTIGEAIIVFEQGARGVTFSVRSPLAAEPQGAGLLLRDVPGGTERDQTARWFPDEMIRRVWVPDDTWPGYAVSPLKAVLDDCERYWTLGRRMRRTYESALVGNGIVWAPSEAATRLPRGQTEPGGIGQPGTDLERDYYAAALRAFQEDDSVEAIAPILWQWSKEFGGPVKIDLSSVLDEKAIEHRGEALEGIARGLNYPSRLLVSGVGDGNHWSDWLLQEQFAKEAIAPKMERIAWGDITEVFLRPGLRSLGARGLFTDDPELYRVGFDLTPIIVHPDQSAMVLELYKLGVVSDSAVLEFAGLDATVAPDSAELQRWVMRTQIMRETIRAMQNPGDSLPSGAEQVIESAPPGGTPILPAVAALDAGSTVRETVRVGPMAGEELGWLD